jgi:hypothetical protein
VIGLFQLQQTILMIGIYFWIINVFRDIWYDDMSYLSYRLRKGFHILQKASQSGKPTTIIDIPLYQQCMQEAQKLMVRRLLPDQTLTDRSFYRWTIHRPIQNLRQMTDQC